MSPAPTDAVAARAALRASRGATRVSVALEPRGADIRFVAAVYGRRASHRAPRMAAGRGGRHPHAPARTRVDRRVVARDRRGARAGCGNRADHRMGIRRRRRRDIAARRPPRCGGRTAGHHAAACCSRGWSTERRSCARPGMSSAAFLGGQRVKPTSPVHRGGAVHVAVRILLRAGRTRAPAEEVTEVALIANGSTTHVLHRLCRAVAGRSRSQPVRTDTKCLL
jgi:hypothetical protein